MITFILGILLLGIFVGLVSGMFGLGGGGIIVPALLLLLPLINVPESQIMFMAMGTAFATMIISTATTSYHHYQHQNIDLKSLRLFLPPLLITVLLTSYIVTSINQNFLKLFFSLFLIYFGLKMLRSSKKRSIVSAEKPANLKTKSIFAAIMIGIIATLGGVSGAGLIVPFFNKIGLSIKKSIGTAAFCGLFLTIFASVGFILNGLKQTEDLPPYSFGYIHIPTVLLISLISVPMTKMGVKIMTRLPDRHLKQSFAIFLITLSIYIMIISLKSLIMLEFS